MTDYKNYFEDDRDVEKFFRHFTEDDYQLMKLYSDEANREFVKKIESCIKKYHKTGNWKVFSTDSENRYCFYVNPRYIAAVECCDGCDNYFKEGKPGLHNHESEYDRCIDCLAREYPLGKNIKPAKR